MNIKLMAAASALALGLAMGGAALADPPAAGTTTTNVNGNHLLSDNNTTVNANKSFTDNADNSDHSTNSVSVDKTANIGFGNGNTKTVTADNGNTKTVTADNNNNQSRTIGSYNTKNVVADSGNTTNTSLDLNARVNVTTQDLAASVSNVSLNSGTNNDEGNRSINQGNVSWSGGAYQNFAGIQTASTNNGIGSNALATTAVSANANVTFGGSH